MSSIILLQRFWSQLLLLSLLLLSLSYLVVVRISLSNAINERDQYKTALEFQNASLLQQKAEYDEKLSKLPTEIEKIRTRYVAVYTNIDDWSGDENATDCENAKSFLSSFNY